MSGFCAGCGFNQAADESGYCLGCQIKIEDGELNDAWDVDVNEAYVREAAAVAETKP